MGTSAQAYISGLYNGASMSVRWDDGLDTWVSDTTKMIYNRSQQAVGIEGNDSYWIAWHEDPTERKKVAWKEVGKDMIGNIIFEWISIDSINGSTSVWKKVDNEFKFIDLSTYKSINNIL